MTGFERAADTGPQFRNISPNTIRVVCAPLDGKGSGRVYCYYLPYVRRACERSKTLPWLARWPCKVGKTDKNDVRDRIAQQFNQTGMFDAPEVRFLVLSDDIDKLETDLKRWLKNNTDKIGGRGLGNEWFEANMFIVRRAYREVMWPRWYHLPVRMVKWLQMAYRAAQRFDCEI